MSSTTPSHIKTRVLIISDTHNATPAKSSNGPFREPLPKADVLLHCGDLTMVGRLEEYETTLNMLKDIDAELKLVIAGNHDISLDETYWKRKGQHMQRLKEPDSSIPAKAKEMWMGDMAKKARVTYLEEGFHEFVLGNGAKLRVYASPYQPEFCDWAFPYYRYEDRYNPVHQSTPGSRSIVENPVPNFPAIDVMMTHGPPLNHLDMTYTNEAVGCEHLARAVKRCRPKVHCFGHIHEGWGAERVAWGDHAEYQEKTETIEVDEEKMMEDGAVEVDLSSSAKKPLAFGKETLMVNASIMTIQYKPRQGPWLVDLDLEKAE